MVILNKNSANTRIFLLFQNTTIVAPVYYLFEFTNEATKSAVYCIPTELSTQVTEYNKFIITDDSTPNPLTGEVSLSTGRYRLKVYEQTSPTNLNPSNLNVVHDDDVQVVDNTTYTNTTYSSTVTNTFYGE